MGLSIDYLYSLTPREFNNICTGYVAKQSIEHQTKWEMARIGWFYSIAPNLKKGAKPTDLMQFDWEKDLNTKTQKLTPEQEKEFFSRWDNLIKKE